MHPMFFLAFAPALAAAADPQTSTLDIRVDNLRNAKGQIHACLTRNEGVFPDCSADPQALTQTVSASARQIRFVGVPPGRYALSLFHDENTNEKLDMFLGIPREGFGFSRNPKIRFGAPKFRQVDIQLDAGITRQTVRMQYLL